MTKGSFWKSAHPWAMVTILFWSLGYVWTKTAMGYFSAGSIGFLRYAVASVMLLVIAAAGGMAPPRRKDLPWFLLAGAVGFFLYMIAYNLGQETTMVATASVLIATVPMITALLSRVFCGERLRPVQWAATAVEFAGVLVLTLLDGVLSGNAGVAWLLLAAVLLSVYNLLQRRLTRTYSALQASAVSIFSGTLLLAVFLPASVREASRAAPGALLCMLLLGIFTSGLAYVAWAKAFAKAETAAQVSNYMFVTPFLTSLLGAAVLGEVPGPSTLVGGGIILAGVLLFNFGGQMQRRIATWHHCG